MNIISIIVGYLVGVVMGITIFKIVNSKVKLVKVKKNKLSDNTPNWLLSDGDKRYLFTQQEIETAKKRAVKIPEDIPN
jgi:hypothetical protein